MKNKVAILIAIIVGLISIIAIQQYISKSVGAKEGGVVKVLTAKRALKAGATLTPSDCNTADIPSVIYNKAPRSFVRDVELGNYARAKLTEAYKADEFICPLTFTSGVQNETLPVEPGNRAVTINVDDVSGVAGLLQRNDYVDIVMVQRLANVPVAEGTGGGSFRGQPMLLNVFRKVRVLTPGRQILTMNAENVGRSGYSTVTVELPVEKATVLAALRLFSQIALLLRNPNDTSGTEDIYNMKVDSAALQETLASIHKTDAGGAPSPEMTPAPPGESVPAPPETGGGTPPSDDTEPTPPAGHPADGSSPAATP
jgi:pilus assembly protein CpaB